MIDVLLKDYLDNELAIPVVLEKPKQVPENYILIELIDGGEDNHINAATFQFHCHADSLYNAAVLADSVSALLKDAISLSAISKAQFGGKNPVINSATKTYKYVLTYNFVYYREET